MTVPVPITGRPERRHRAHTLRVAIALLIGFASNGSAQAPRFEVTVNPSAYVGPLTGRLVLILATDDEPEPRLTLGPNGPAIFGIDLDRLRPGEVAVLDSNAAGYPSPLMDLPHGDYVAQVVVNVYDQVHRSDGHTLWLPMNDGRIEFFNNAAGNVYSEPRRIRIGGGTTVSIDVDRVIPAPPDPVDTEWVKHVRIRSEKLSTFWGRPTYIHATVLLPRGYAESGEIRYPAIYAFGHNVPFSFTPDSSRVRNAGTIHPVTGLETGFDFYKQWNADSFPRVVAITFQQATPYFPDSYSVNSANNGPYGDAIVEEVIPFLERRFHLIAMPYARIVEGASTSGWQSLALQLRNPDLFGGAWILQPDPIDFTRYQLVNLYDDENAFELRVGNLVAERPFRRTVEGQVVWTVRDLSRFEDVLGSHGRSGYQLEGWEAVYGPAGPDGYPRPLWDKLTGVIDRDVAHAMREGGYDLRVYAEREWPVMGPKLQGKLHFFAGDMDDFYLNLAVYRFEEFLKSTMNPRSDATFTYGRPMKGHSWHAFPWAELVRRIATHVKDNAPPGGDAPEWWR
ncbi:MAG: alpha/beta hydrolase-fold protein [Longimicrobiales bacterium]